jgi:CheY-like chemotaxis protein
MCARILVVDDDRDNADSLARLVTILGHDASTAYSGMQAVEMAVNLRPGLALIDVEMPGMDGYETAKRLRGLLGCETVLVAVTGWARQEDKQQATRSGFDLHYAKPLRLDALEELLAIPTPTT